MNEESEKNLFTLKKNERLSHTNDISLLFSKSNKQTKLFFPIRVVWHLKTITNGIKITQILVSVSKRYHKRANKRNLIKRRIKEAYRQNKYSLVNTNPNTQLIIGFVYCTNTITDYTIINDQIQACLKFIHQQIAKKDETA